MERSAFKTTYNDCKSSVKSLYLILNSKRIGKSMSNPLIDAVVEAVGEFVTSKIKK